MNDAAASWAPQQLAEFLGAVSGCHDELHAAREGVERAAESVEAECAALVRGDAVLASVGWLRFDVPERQLAAVAAAREGLLDVPGTGPCPAVALPLEGSDALLVIARAGAPFTPEETTLLRGMVRGLALAMRLLETIDAERGLRARANLAAAENVRLLETLRKRQRVLEAMARIQRAISRREPLEGVLDTIVAAAGELLGDDAPALVLVDPDDPGWLVFAAQRGYDAVLAEDDGSRHRVGTGVTGRAVAEARLIVVEDYPSMPDARAPWLRHGLQAAMAAPVHEDGRVIGSLLLSSVRPGRVFSRAEQDMLSSFAEHASLALTDARRVDTMLHQALHDALTGLPNRALFTDRIQHALVQARRRGTTCGVIFLDLDRFKTVNDSLGHGAGDELLVAVARRLAGSLRSADTAARLGGDEFAVLLEDLGGVPEAVLVAERITAALSTPIVISGREVYVKVSLGIAVGGHEASELLRQADVAMYRAKRDGKGRFRVFEDSMQAEVVERLELEGELLRAIERDEVEVHYQPVIALDGQTLAGFEALARWTHPTRGLVPPPQFIPLAEENGSIIELGRQILRTACRQAAQWLQEFPTAEPRIMSVNLSGRQLEDPNIVADVAAALADSGLPASALVLEITETVLMHDTEATISRLTALKALGVRLAVDDFGTGYSSLRYLRRFPIDILKMAKPFVDGLDTGDDEGRALARAIVDLASSLKLACIAEGIEAGAQADVLHDLGCGMGQGFHFARPMASDAMTALIAEPPGAGRAFAMPSTPI
ncbi:putative bifunctional diguanylate cyclase/phosphodiesterase [Baekduia sp.]|jgi:diguanylate cyclase (GGDEF)-like protein|uniref:putative bifunctional diguanylate cyclase/phosphodiesterase n=1 Tax=Baekduia sp. TaxID=2600305 RepID=UPI002E09A6D9|nr:EAL domain-containing protein [Baekduia sp.]